MGSACCCLCRKNKSIVENRSSTEEVFSGETFPIPYPYCRNNAVETAII